jgi:PAS domain S-box-containing protein
MPLTIQNKIQAGFALALAFLLLTGAATWWSARRNVETFRAADHTYRVLDKLEAILVDVLNMETGARGFVISGNESFLEPYQNGLAEVQKSLEAARQLTRDNPNQQRRLAILEPLIQDRVAYAKETIHLRRSGDTAGAYQHITSGQGKLAMDEIRKLIREMDKEETQLLHQRAARAEATAHTTIETVIFSGVLTLVLFGIASVVVRRDFQKRQQAEAERDRFFTLAQDMLCVANTEGYFRRVNPAFTATLGWSAEELLARQFIEFIHPDDRAATLREVEKLAGGQPTLNFENRYRCKDGTWKLLAWRSTPQPDGTVYATARDVTRQHEAEEALRRSEESLAVTLNSIGDAVLATDTDGRITRLNPIAEKLVGWTQAEALGRPVGEVFNIVNETTRQPAVVPVARVLATGEIHGLANHTVLIARNGTERPIADSAAPIRDKDGRVLGVVLVFRDVTEEQQAEKIIRESERRLRTMNEELERRVQERTAEVRQALATLDATEDAAFIFDPKTLRHSYVNEGAVRQLGYTRAELLGRTPVDFKPEFDEARHRKLLEPMLRGQVSAHRFTTLHRHKEGRDVPVEINLQYVTPAGESPRFIAIVRDITERRKTERLALRSQRLESIGTLAGGVAHDLNNALAPIMMGLELLKLQHPGASELVATFQNSAKRAADMVRQLLTFAKGAEGERVFLQPKHLLKEMGNIVKSTFPKNIQLQVQCASDLSTLRGDATQLHQVLLNLCVNARDAMPAGGVLTLEAENREVDAVYASSVPDARPGKYVVLRVRDTGTGIPPEIVDRIFEPFFTTKGPDKGTGLGLSTVIGIVKGHGGFVQVYSQPGQGSTFAAYLPADTAKLDTTVVTKTETEFRGHGETILFVDDEAALRDVARAVLRRLNFKAVVATDGADGLMQVAEHRAELRAVLTDLHMPHMDGLAFIRALRRLLPAIPIVVATGRMEDKAMEELNALGIAAHLEKPFTERQLVEVLKTVFSAA